MDYFLICLESPGFVPRYWCGSNLGFLSDVCEDLFVRYPSFSVANRVLERLRARLECQKFRDGNYCLSVLSAFEKSF